MAASVIELLAAVLSGTRRRPVQALITTVYPILSGEETPMAGTIEIDYINMISMDFETPIMSGIIEIEEITLNTILIEYIETESPMAGVIEIEEITLSEVLIQYSENEEPMSGVIEIEEITLVDVLVSASETESPMSGTIEIEEITLTTA